MDSLMTPLKSVVLVILISEFLKELLIGESYKKYIQFAVSLFIFGFFLSALFHVELSLPDFPQDIAVSTEENLLIAQLQNETEAAIGNMLSENNLSYEEIIVTLSPAYEIEQIYIKSQEEKSSIDALLKGEFPYEVVGTAKR